jgi:putative endonuclease
MWFVYILECQDGTYYTGCTINVASRFKNHVLGLGGKYTRSHKPLRVVHQEQVVTKSEALKREFQIKRLTRGQKQELIDMK